MKFKLTLLIPTIILLLIACPKPTPPDPTTCDKGYHPCGLDSQECCLDTTSHEFAWEVDTLGEYGSWVYGIDIVNADDIWACGEFRTDSTKYNLAHWNGQDWTLLGTEAAYRNGFLSEKLTSIMVFAQDDIWALGGYPYHWDGEQWTIYHLQDMGLMSGGFHGELWGSSSSDMYFSGKDGHLAHFDGSSFSMIDVGVDTRFVDISGTPDGSQVFVVGYNFLLPIRTTLVKISEGNANILYDAFDHDINGGPEDWGIMSSESVLGATAYVVTFKGLMKYNFVDSTYTLDPAFEMYDYHDMQVQTANDIFLVGGGGQYVHFNGSSWLFDNQLYENHFFASQCGDLLDDMAVIGGYTQGGLEGVIARGYR